MVMLHYIEKGYRGCFQDRDYFKTELGLIRKFK